MRQRVCTERIQEITNPVRWERNSKTGLLDVTPVGEYVEVVDIDPASGVVCPPSISTSRYCRRRISEVNRLT
jgi:hypothetical protein